MKPFDLEKALAGEPVKMGNGRKAFVTYKLPEEMAKSECNRLVGFYLDENGYFEEHLTWFLDGSYNKRDLSWAIAGMWEEPRSRVQLNLPTPLKVAENKQEIFYISAGLGIVVQSSFDRSDPTHQILLDSGMLFATKENAEEWLNAMQNSRSLL